MVVAFIKFKKQWELMLSCPCHQTLSWFIIEVRVRQLVGGLIEVREFVAVGWVLDRGHRINLSFGSHFVVIELVQVDSY